MQPVSFKRHRFPPDVIRLAVWLHFRFTLSLRDVEEMLAQRGVEASYETVRCWTLKFGRAFARNLRRSRPKPTGAALRLLRKLLRRNGIHPESFVTDKLASYRAAFRELHCGDRHRLGRFKSQRSAHRFLATHAAVHNNFNVQRHLIRRSTLRLFRADAELTWATATAAARTVRRVSRPEMP